MHATMKPMKTYAFHVVALRPRVGRGNSAMIMDLQPTKQTHQPWHPTPETSHSSSAQCTHSNVSLKEAGRHQSEADMHPRHQVNRSLIFVFVKHWGGFGGFESQYLSKVNIPRGTLLVWVVSGTCYAPLVAFGVFAIDVCVPAHANAIQNRELAHRDLRTKGYGES